MVYAFCVAERADVEVDSERCCLTDGMPCIPPSWGSRAWTWRDGTWVPYKPRPEGYVWTPKFTDKPSAPRTRAPKAEVSPALDRLLLPPEQQPCARCGTLFVPRQRALQPQRFCGSVCRASFSAAQKRAEAAAVRTAETIACVRCGATAPAHVPTGGPRRRYCSDTCRLAASNARYQRTPMAVRGQVCRACGRGDRPHRANGLCTACYQRGWDAAHRDGVTA